MFMPPMLTEADRNRRRERAAAFLFKAAAQREDFPRDYMPRVGGHGPAGRNRAWVSPRRLRRSAYLLLTKSLPYRLSSAGL